MRKERRAQPNMVSHYERGLRSVIGFAILGRLLTQQPDPWTYAFFSLLMLYLLATALVAWDPFYAVVRRVSTFLTNTRIVRQQGTSLKGA